MQVLSIKYYLIVFRKLFFKSYKFGIQRLPSTLKEQWKNQNKYLYIILKVSYFIFEFNAIIFNSLI